MGVRKNYLYSIIYHVLLVILPLFTAPYLARVIGAEGIGIYAYTYSIASYFILFAKLGIRNYGTRKIAKVRNDKLELDKTFTTMYIQQIIVSSFVFIAYIIYTFLILRTNFMIAFIQSICVFSSIFYVDWFYFGIEDFKTVTLRNFIIKIFATILIFTFVNEKSDLWIYALIIGISMLLSKVSIWISVRERIGLIAIDAKELFEHFKHSVVLFIPVLATSVFRIMDKIMLGSYSTMLQVGYYENAEKLIYLLLGFISSLGKVTMPKISNLIENGKIEESREYIDSSMRFIIFLTSAFAFGLAGIAPEFIPLFYGKAFVSSIYLLQYLSITLIFIGWANVIRTQYIMPMNKDHIYIKAVIIGAVLNISMNILLIRRYSALGAVIATFFTEFIVSFYQSYKVRKELRLISYIKSSYIFIIIGFIMFCFTRTISVILVSSIKGVLIQIITGATIYLSLSFLYLRKIKDYRTINIIKNRVLNLIRRSRS